LIEFIFLAIFGSAAILIVYLLFYENVWQINNCDECTQETNFGCKDCIYGFSNKQALESFSF
jgi:hypothetical protein